MGSCVANRLFQSLSITLVTAASLYACTVHHTVIFSTIAFQSKEHSSNYAYTCILLSLHVHKQDQKESFAHSTKHVGSA